MAKEIEEVALWDRINQATLPNQVLLLCNSMDVLAYQVDQLMKEVDALKAAKPKKP